MSEIDVQSIARLGMEFEKARIEAATINVANTNNASTSVSDVTPLFMAVIGSTSSSQAEVSLQSVQKAKAVYQPSHPLANDQGIIYLPDVDLAHEMLTLSSAKRAYEANVKVYNSYKQMSAKALEIGK